MGYCFMKIIMAWLCQIWILIMGLQQYTMCDYPFVFQSFFHTSPNIGYWLTFIGLQKISENIHQALNNWIFHKTSEFTLSYQIEILTKSYKWVTHDYARRSNLNSWRVEKYGILAEFSKFHQHTRTFVITLAKKSTTLIEWLFLHHAATALVFLQLDLVWWYILIFKTSRGAKMQQYY